MLRRLKCSACGVRIPRRDWRCPSCGLRLRAAGTSKRFTALRFPALGVALAAMVLLALHVNSSSRRAEVEAENARDAFAADLESGRLNSPEAFENRCMTPQKIIQTKDGTELEYSFAEIHVTFRPTVPPILESETVDIDSNGRVKSDRIPASPKLVFELLGCK
jgi:hypothetical protein